MAIASDSEDIRERLTRLESHHGETSRLVAVLVNEMQGIRWLLRSILGTIIVGVVGAVITAWVQIPRGHYNPSTPRIVEVPK